MSVKAINPCSNSTPAKKIISFPRSLAFGLIFLGAFNLLFPATTVANNPNTRPTFKNLQNFVIGSGYRARIQRTRYNVAHITAQDLPSAWFGQGYAMAEDRICTLLDQIIKVRSRRARFFGPGVSNRNVDSDFGYKHLGIVAAAERNWPALPATIRDMLTAHAAGINAFVADAGHDGLPQYCRNADWIVDVTPMDLFAYSMDFGLSRFSNLILPILSNTRPPGANPTSDAAVSAQSALAMQRTKSSIGSNGWGLGTDLTESGNGLLLAHPHFSWEGELQMWESHLTVPGEIDVYGVTLPGIPNTLVGFNKAVAWTLAVTPAAHETLYKLTLTADDPTQYIYEGEIRAMKARTYTVEVLNITSGELEQQSRTLWRSHYGPIVSLPASPLVAWNTNYVLTYRDANLENSTYLSQFLEMSQASGMDSFIEAHRRSVGMPFGHTIAASVNGDTWYADGSPVPNISAETYKAWQQAVESDPAVSIPWRIGLYTLDGSTARDEWIGLCTRSGCTEQ